MEDQAMYRNHQGAMGGLLMDPHTRLGCRRSDVLEKYEKHHQKDSPVYFVTDSSFLRSLNSIPNFWAARYQNVPWLVIPLSRICGGYAVVVPEHSLTETFDAYMCSMYPSIFTKAIAKVSASHCQWLPPRYRYHLVLWVPNIGQTC